MNKNLEIYLLLVMITGLIAFQIAIALGAQLGKYAYGGQNPGKLPKGLRITSAVSVIVLLAMQGHLLAQAKLLTPLLPANLNQFANYVIAAFFAVGFLINSISRSKAERNIWAPFGLVATILSITIIL